VDPLSDLLRVVRLDGAFFYAVEAAGSWSIDTVAARELSPRIMPSAEHLISYHVVTHGRCYGGLVGEERVELTPGDVIVFPHGDAHIMASGPDLRATPHIHASTSTRYADTVVLGDHAPGDVSLVCGFLGCDRGPFNPLLAALPRRMHMRGVSSAWLDGFTRRLTEEARLGHPGADSALTRLAELMFIEVLRRYLADLPAGQTGWLAGLRDEVVGRVLRLFHGQPAHPWSLDEVAREVASSRSHVARQFALLVGMPPMHYLTQWRMQIAANLLAQSGTKVAAIAAEVGYDSEAAFSRAFKKATSRAPGAWREARRNARAQPSPP
jgi:AraC-like DNA-binding protein